MRRDKRKYNILVIEDNPGDYILIEEYLEEMMVSPQISHVKNFKDAKDLLTGKQLDYDVILLDLTLPDNRGEPLITEILGYCSVCPVVALTGYTDIEFSIRSLSLGVSDYLLKDDLNANSLYKSIVFNIERKKASLALENSEKRYSNLFHLSPLPMFVYSLESLLFQDVNDAAIRSYGYSREEFMSMDLNNITVKEDDSITATGILHAAGEGKPPQKSARHKKKNGEIIQVELQQNIIEFKGEKAEIIVASDITERHRFIREIQDQNRKLSEIAWMQSHVIRAPLAKIMGLIALIKSNPEGSPDKDVLLTYLLESANELDEAIRRISAKTNKG